MKKLEGSDMDETVKLLQDSIKTVESDLKELKEQFTFIITDKDRPLEERWDIFKNAPTFLKDHDTSIYHFDFIKSDDGRSENWHRLFDYYERHQTVYLLDVIDNFESIHKMLNSDPPQLGYKDHYKKWPCFKDPETIVRAKEQVLKDNIETFCFDW
jgi:hypothetical protein